MHSFATIVGAGPVGMTLALDLARRGVPVTIVEKGAADRTPGAKCNHISAHSLETFRQLGLADEIRQLGLPANHPHDVVFATSMTGHELCRIAIPPRRDRFGTSGYADSNWPTPEPPHRCNQMYFEPLLRERLNTSDGIRVVYDATVEAVEQDETGVTAIGRHSQTGEPLHFRSDYLIGCDGGSSLVRRAIGGKFVGDEVISLNRSITIRAPDLRGMTSIGSAWMTWLVQERMLACLVAVNGQDLWTFHFFLEVDNPDAKDFDCKDGIRKCIGASIRYDVVNEEDWQGRRLVSDRLRHERLFICGDAAHIWIPFAGYGMNAGIADCMNLSWQLAATYAGWAGPGLLDAHEAERHPITQQVSQHVMGLALDNMRSGNVGQWISQLEAPEPMGSYAREMAGRWYFERNVGQFACKGLNFGPYFDASPLICYDDQPAPAYSLTHYQPSTVPGCRAPHIWLPDGTPLYDCMGMGFALVRRNPTIDVSSLLGAAASRDFPVIVVDIADAIEAEVYDHELVLVRPDRMICWRGNRLPTDPEALLDKISGHNSTTHTDSALAVATYG